MRYCWDEDKNRRNVALHGIAFEDAQTIFEGPTVERVDDRFDYGEVRMYAIGLVNGLEITVVTRIEAIMKDVSSRRGGRNRMKDAAIGKTSDSKHGAVTNWTRLRRMKATEIRKGIQADPDAHATDEQFWKDARVILPARKAVVTMRLDRDLLEWFRRQRGYQTRINAILRTYMNAHATEGR
ncbi:MAG TPA: BrnT family toxin [Terriglobia bacterium]|nr:BrnT family toxin [Terriglobia bacterium]